MRVGFIGLGAMGLGMAGCINARHELTVFNRSPGKAADLVASGARIAGRIEDVGNCRVVGSMLSDDGAVESVFLHGDNLRVPFRHGTVHVSHSTISPDLVDRLDKAHRKAGAGFVCAPVLGRPDKAASGQLVTVAAGAREDFRTARPVLEAFSTSQFLIGDEPRQAAVAKLGVNFLIAAALEALAECFAMVRRAKIDPEQFMSLITGTIFDAAVYNAYAPLVAREISPSPGFKMTLGLKDVDLAMREARALGAGMPIAELLAERLQMAISQGYGDDDWAALARFAARQAGLPPPAQPADPGNLPGASA